jgi:hypothetical protein
MKKAKSSYDLAQQRRTPSTDVKFRNPLKYQSSTDLNEEPQMSSVKANNSKNDGKHKVVIYFSDAYNNICNKVNEDEIDRNRLAVNDVKPPKAHQNSSKEFMAQLKTVLEEKSKFTNKFNDRNGGEAAAANKFKPPVPEKPSTNMLQINQTSSNSQDERQLNGKSSQKLLPSFIESIDENNVIKLKIEQNFRRASELVNLISSLPKKNNTKNLKKSKRDSGHDASSIHELNFSNGKF